MGVRARDGCLQGNAGDCARSARTGSARAERRFNRLNTFPHVQQLSNIRTLLREFPDMTAQVLAGLAGDVRRARDELARTQDRTNAADAP